jgi:hypothetical protein
MSAFIKTVGKEIKAVGKEMLTDTAKSIARQATDSVKNAASQKIRQYSDRAVVYQPQYQMAPQQMAPQYAPQQMVPQYAPQQMVPQQYQPVAPTPEQASPQVALQFQPTPSPSPSPSALMTHTGCTCSCPRAQAGGAGGLMKFSKRDLRQIAGAMHIRGRSRLTKDQLAGAIASHWY